MINSMPNYEHTTEGLSTCTKSLAALALTLASPVASTSKHETKFITNAIDNVKLMMMVMASRADADDAADAADDDVYDSDGGSP